MSISNAEKIKEHFKLPIFYNEKKMELNKNIIADLELVKTIDVNVSDVNPLYHYAFQPNTIFAKKIIEQMANYYTTDTTFLKDTQNFVSNYTALPHLSSQEKGKIIDIWDEIKNDTGFKEKYHYVDWPMWEHLNKSDYFLQIMSVYNLAAPVISLCIPFIILIVPFFIIKIKGLNVDMNEYIEILKTIASNHAIGKLFTKFHSVKMDEKIYILLSAAFYLFSIYQNILSCMRFHQNMTKIHSHLNDIKKYIEDTETTMHNLSHYI